MTKRILNWISNRLATTLIKPKTIKWPNNLIQLRKQYRNMTHQLNDYLTNTSTEIIQDNNKLVYYYLYYLFII